MIRNTVYIAFVTLVHATCWADDPRGIATDQDIALLKTSRIECLVGNNKSHREEGVQHHAGYNGLFRLTSTDQKESPFVPAYAGLNLEHYFDARPRREGHVFFEPRHASMSLERVSQHGVELHQPPTPTFGIESWTRFVVREPYYVDFSFRCVPRRDELEGNFFGVFWASYINGPLDKSIYFLDVESSLNQPLWRQLATQQHNRDSTVRGKADSIDLVFQAGEETLFSSISPLRYSEPFFYGRFRNMVLIYVFRQNPHLRFTHSPSGGGNNRLGDDTNPAWDFQLIVPNAQVNKEYRLEGCLIYKPWQNRADVLSEVRRYLATPQVNPSANQNATRNQ